MVAGSAVNACDAMDEVLAVIDVLADPSFEGIVT